MPSSCWYHTLGSCKKKLFPGRFLVRDLSDIPPRERFFVKIYAFLYLLGISYACYFLFTAVCPFLWGIFTQSIQTISMGSRVDIGHWLDAMFALIIYSSYSVLIVYLLWRQRPRLHLRQKSQVLPTSPSEGEQAFG